MSIPRTMLTSTSLQPTSVVLQRINMPDTGPGQLLLRVPAVGACRSDTPFYETGVIGNIAVKEPIVLRHETGSEIAAVGEGVDPWRIGVQVAIDPKLPCRNCDFCKDGSCRLCTDIRFYGAHSVDGSFCEHVLIDDDYDSIASGALDVKPLAPGLFSLDNIEDALQKPKTDSTANNSMVNSLMVTFP